MKKHIALGLILILLIVGSASAMRVYGAITPTMMGQGSTATVPMTVELSGNEPKTIAIVDHIDPSGLNIAIDNPKFRIVPGQTVPITATFAVPENAPLGLVKTNIVIHPHTKCKLITPVTVPVSLNIVEPRITRVAITSTPPVGPSPLLVTFNGLVEGGGAQTQTTYQWAYTGTDGVKTVFSTERNAKHTFIEKGTYSISFKAANPLGSKEVTVNNKVVVT